MLTYEQVKNNPAVQVYVKRADEALKSIGYTEHSVAHVTKVAETAAYILRTLGYDEHEVEMARIAGYMHDIGNLVNRTEHAQTGAIMAFTLLTNMGGEPDEIASIISAIGNHDESTANPANPIAAALILSDKTDVRRSRVRSQDHIHYDIHDRVNYSVINAVTKINEEKDRNLSRTYHRHALRLGYGLFRNIPLQNDPLPQGRRYTEAEIPSHHQRSAAAVIGSLTEQCFGTMAKYLIKCKKSAHRLNFA